MGIRIKSIKNIKQHKCEPKLSGIISFNYAFVDDAIKTIQINKKIKNKTKKIKYDTILENYTKNNNRCVCSICGIEANLAKIYNTRANTKVIRLYHYDIKTNVALVFNIDHINPRSNGGLDDITNTQFVCIICNIKKADIIPTEYITKKETTSNIFINLFKNLYLKLFK